MKGNVWIICDGNSTLVQKSVSWIIIAIYYDDSLVPRKMLLSWHEIQWQNHISIKAVIGKVVDFSPKVSVIPTSFRVIYIDSEFLNDTQMTEWHWNGRNEIKNYHIFPRHLGWQEWRECTSNDSNNHSTLIPVIPTKCHSASFHCSNDHGMNGMT